MHLMIKHRWHLKTFLHLFFIPFHIFINHILFAFHPSLIINYLFRLPNLGILKSVIMLSLLLHLLLLSYEKTFCQVFSKNARHIYFEFCPVITTSCTNKALALILWYSEWINAYDKYLRHVKLHSWALKIK